jgi:hypothetical protein
MLMVMSVEMTVEVHQISKGRTKKKGGTLTLTSPRNPVIHFLNPSNEGVSPCMSATG